ncbi:MAG: glycosyltransferase, partial [Verrucomicrobiota bacterium]|nr:glycosyltransferase [Verrucomicrobiota bacterium]
MATSDKISVAMTTYNGEKYLREQLDSLYSQTRIPDEIIVTDDLSSD